jgi:hypothetical protein
LAYARARYRRLRLRNSDCSSPAPNPVYGSECCRWISQFTQFGQLFGGGCNRGFRRSLIEHVALIGAAGRDICGAPQRAPAFMSYLAFQLSF